MAYVFYLKKCLLPVTPDKLTTKINGKNKTVTLINEGEVNILKKPGLTDVEFTCLIPNVRYPFGTYKNGFQGASYFLSYFEDLKTSQEPFQFIVTRAFPNGKSIYDTNMKVSLESYTMEESADEGFDCKVKIKLKQWRGYGTKTVNVSITQKKVTAAPEAPRPVESKPAPKTYKVGDIVNFHGGTHYVSSYSGSKGYSARAGQAKITIANGSGKTHPWHLIHTDSGSNVYGWVDDGTFS